MNKDEARKKLEEQLKQMQEQSQLHEQAEQELDKNKKKNSKISGPRNDMEYQKMMNDIKESGNEQDDK